MPTAQTARAPWPVKLERCGLCGMVQQYTEKNEKKHSEEKQTLRAGCSKAEPNIFSPPQRPFPGVRDGQNLISWRWSRPLPTNPVW